MPLHHGDFQNVLLQIHLGGVAAVGGDDFAVHQADDRPGTGIPEVLQLETGQVEGVVGAIQEGLLDLRRGEFLDLPVIPELAALEDHLHGEGVKVVDDGEVRQISRGDGAAVVELIVACGIVGGGLHHENGVGALLDRPAAVVVDVSLLEKVAGVLVVGAEHAAVSVLGCEQGQEGI